MASPMNDADAIAAFIKDFMATPTNIGGMFSKWKSLHKQGNYPPNADLFFGWIPKHGKTEIFDYIVMDGRGVCNRIHAKVGRGKKVAFWYGSIDLDEYEGDYKDYEGVEVGETDQYDRVVEVLTVMLNEYQAVNLKSNWTAFKKLHNL